MKLTKIIIDKLSYNGSPCHTVFDEELSGFGIRIYASGKKSFFIDFRVKGRQRRMILGKYGKLTLDEARKLAREKFVSISSGGDPLEQRRMSKLGDTMNDLAKNYIENYAKPRKKTWPEDQRRLRDYILPVLGNRKIESIRRVDITALHQKVGQFAPYEANRTLSLLSAMIKHAIRSGMVVENFHNPCILVEKFKERPRDRWVTHEEMPRLWDAIQAEENLYIRHALELLLLTGLRKSEMLTLKWENINFDRRELYLADTKAGRPHTLPLSDEEIEILQALPRQSGNPFVFCGRKEGTRLVNLNDAWLRIRVRADLPDVRIHDLRRTCGSWMATSGKSLPIIGRVLNQSSQSVTAIYARLSENPIRTAIEEHSKKVIEIVNLRNQQHEKTA